MTSPKKEISPAKTRYVPVRLTEELYMVLSNDAATAGLSKGEYIRKLIVNSHPVLRPEIVFNDSRILNALRDIGKISGTMSKAQRNILIEEAL
ncbi:MAG: hypothetical protein IJ917_10930 [Firmicutes bacterium]|nr:hypothetical protein [Bacillota bacterium]